MPSIRALMFSSDSGDMTASISPASIMRPRILAVKWINIRTASGGKQNHHRPWHIPVSFDSILGSASLLRGTDKRNRHHSPWEPREETSWTRISKRRV
jgi:hypothetical protein